MKKRVIAGLVMAAMLAMTVAGCGNTATDAPAAPSAPAEPPAVESVAEIQYSNVNYDFAEDIAKERAAVSLVPAAAEIGLTVADAKGATGVVLVASAEEGNTTDYYLNALVAGNELVFTGDIKSATSSASGALEVAEGTVKVTPAAIQATNPADEVITFVMADGAEYKVHTVNQLLPVMTVTGTGVAEENAGVYTFSIDHFMLRVNTQGELVYYRNLGCVGELLAENFQKHKTPDGDFYSYFVELRKEFRNANGGFSSGMFVVLDENYTEIEEMTLLPNDEANHTHGEGYLDQHEFLVLGDGHYITLSYTPECVSNLPETVEGIDGGSTAYVWAGVFQEVIDGKVVKEINTTDYPLLYESAVEKIDYANSTDQGVTVVINNAEVPSLADGWMDYVHPNSLDYTLDADGNVSKLLVSMRDQSAVYQFDFATGAMEWILGGKASTLTGYEDYTSTRTDEKGTEFAALTFGQHYARYINKDEKGMITGPIEISIFDNQTGVAPFLRAVPVPTDTRVFKATIDTEAKTATIFDEIKGTALDALTGKYHNASHCGSVEYHADQAVVIGWGLHGVVDNIGAMAPAGTISDIGFDDLRQGVKPIFTEYDMENGAVTFELSCTRNPLVHSAEGLFSYRTYKTVD